MSNFFYNFWGLVYKVLFYKSGLWKHLSPFIVICLSSFNQKTWSCSHYLIQFSLVSSSWLCSLSKVLFQIFSVSREWQDWSCQHFPPIWRRRSAPAVRRGSVSSQSPAPVPAWDPSWGRSSEGFLIISCTVWKLVSSHPPACLCSVLYNLHPASISVIISIL